MAAVSLTLSRCPRYFLPNFRAFCSKVSRGEDFLIFLEKRFMSVFLHLQAVIDRGVVLGVYEVGNEDKPDVENLFTDAAKKFNSRTSGRLKEMIKL